MKKALFLTLFIGISLSACAVLQGGLEPKMVVKCDGVKGEISMTASEAKSFVEDIKNGNKDGQVCKLNLDFCIAAIQIAEQGKFKCSINPAI